MIGLVRWLVVTLLSSWLLLSNVSAAPSHHLKAQVHRRHHKDWRSFFKRSWDNIYAVCVFTHYGGMFWSEHYSIGFFDRQGVLLDKFCDEEWGFGFYRIAEMSTNSNDWSTTVIDDVSTCFLHKDEVQDAELLMNSYNCKD